MTDWLGRARIGAAAGCLLSATAILPATSRAAEQPNQAAVTNPLMLKPLEDLSATRNRPLSSPSRRPPPPPPVVATGTSAPAPVDPPNLSLVGIMFGAHAAAIVRDAGADKPKIVHAGEDLDGWTVSGVQAQALLLKHDDRLMTYSLFKGGRGAADETVVVPQRPPPIVEVNANGVLTAHRVRRIH